MQYRVMSARERGYLVNVEEKRGRAARYRPGNPLPQDVIILPERIEGVNPHPRPASHTPEEETPWSEDQEAGVWGCEATAEGSESTHACTVCGEPLDPVLADLGDTTHPMCAS